MKPSLFVLTILIFIGIGGKCFSQTADLKVVVNHINEKKGKIRIGIFDDAIDFKSKKNPVAATEISAKDSTVYYVFSSLTCERIAVAIFHDRNSNGELDTKKLGIPLEGVGFSSKVASKLHQPIFPEASFLLKSDTTIFINLYYTKQE
jgi:uncharacterized protein (DUF2141 family)